MREYKSSSLYQHAKAQNTSLSAFLNSFRNAIVSKIEDDTKEVKRMKSDLKIEDDADDSTKRKIENAIKRTEKGIDKLKSYQSVPLPTNVVATIYNETRNANDTPSLAQFCKSLDAYSSAYLLMDRLGMLKNTKETVNA